MDQTGRLTHRERNEGRILGQQQFLLLGPALGNVLERLGVEAWIALDDLDRHEDVGVAGHVDLVDLEAFGGRHAVVACLQSGSEAEGLVEQIVDVGDFFGLLV